VKNGFDKIVIEVFGKEYSTKIQKTLLQFGCRWMNSGNKIVDYYDMKIGYIKINHDIMSYLTFPYKEYTIYNFDMLNKILRKEKLKRILK